MFLGWLQELGSLVGTLYNAGQSLSSIQISPSAFFHAVLKISPVLLEFLPIISSASESAKILNDYRSNWCALVDFILVLSDTVFKLATYLLILQHLPQNNRSGWWPQSLLWTNLENKKKNFNELKFICCCGVLNFYLLRNKIIFFPYKRKLNMKYDFIPYFGTFSWWLSSVLGRSTQYWSEII